MKLIFSAMCSHWRHGSLSLLFSKWLIFLKPIFPWSSIFHSSQKGSVYVSWSMPSTFKYFKDVTYSSFPACSGPQFNYRLNPREPINLLKPITGERLGPSHVFLGMHTTTLHTHWGYLDSPKYLELFKANYEISFSRSFFFFFF